VKNLRFDSKKKRCQSTSEQAIRVNKKIRNIEDQIEFQLKEFVGPNPTLEAIARFLDQVVLNKAQEESFMLKDMAQQWLDRISDPSYVRSDNTRVTQSTLVAYGSAVRKYKDFADDIADINLLECDLAKAVELIDRRNKIDLLDNHLRRYVNWLGDKGATPKTQQLYFVVVKMVLEYASTQGLVINTGVKLTVKANDKAFLHPSQVAAILNSLHVRDRLTDPKDLLTFDVVIVMLATSLRISDALQLKQAHIVTEVGVPMIIGYGSQKRDERSECVIPEDVYQLLLANIRKYGHVYSLPPAPRDYQLVRERMRKVFDQPEFPFLQDNIAIKKYSSDRTTRDIVVTPLINKFSPHMMRRSNLTAQLAAGVDERAVKRAGGFKGNSAAFEGYIDYVRETQVRETSKFVNALKGIK
jgi:integrase